MGQGGIPKERYPDSRPISSLQPKPIERLPIAIAPKRDGLCSWAQKQTQSPMCWLTNATDPIPFSDPRPAYFGMQARSTIHLNPS